MSDLAYGTQDSAPAYKAGLTNWGAIWAGVFTFAAIWAVFEALAVAIFGAGFSMGMAIWTIVLTVIAMYIAGLETGRLADVANRHDGLIHGVIMFGLSVVSAALLMSVANGLFAGGAPAHSSS
ncbi:MAG TPA: hypothetical protein VKV05_11380, partial [Terriglobales bacterium]|nr:hypothetical protein [Terriglobales bacterium]